MSQTRIQHECPETVSTQWSLLSDCAGEGVGTGAAIGIIAAVVAVLGLVGWLVWRRLQLRQYME